MTSKKLSKPKLTVNLDFVPNPSDSDESIGAVCFWLDPGDGIRRLFSYIDEEDLMLRIDDEERRNPLAYIQKKINHYKELAPNLNASFKNYIENDALEEFVDEAFQ
jgi:hypothetical protein